MRTIRPQAGPQEQFLASSADIVIYGGAAGGGKTFALLMEPLRHVSNPEFGAVIFRRTSVQVRNEGGLWDTSEALYPFAGGQAVETKLYWDFPSGAKIRFAYLQYENDNHNFQGSQIPLIGWDELTHFSESQFFYLLSRNRSTCGVRPYVRATCNPDAASWVARFIAWWLDPETGLPIPGRAGVIRWFVRINGQIEWADTAEDLITRHGEECKPKSCSFIPATIHDNQALLSADPGYMANLKALPFVEQGRLLGGNWKITDNEGAYWQHNPEYFEEHIWCEGWPQRFEYSVAVSDPSLGKTEKSDPSAIIFLGYASGVYYVDADIQRRTADKLADDGVNMFYSHKPDVFGCEANGFQQLMRLAYLNSCRVSGRPAFPVAQIQNNENKEVRIKRLGPYLAAKLIRIRNTAGGQMLYQQLRSFGISDAHDDGPDALEMALRLLRAYVGERKIGELTHG